MYGLNDASLFDVVLEAGEYIVPLLVDRQGPENKWPDRWKQWIRDYPKALTTYLKPSEAVVPFRVEAFESVPNIQSVLDPDSSHKPPAAVLWLPGRPRHCR